MLPDNSIFSNLISLNSPALKDVSKLLHVGESTCLLYIISFSLCHNLAKPLDIIDLSLPHVSRKLLTLLIPNYFQTLLPI